MTGITLIFVVAMGENRVIGRDNQMPWHLRSDLKRFKALTWGKPMIMGRKTFQSIGKPLPGRETVVLTRDREWSTEGAHVAHDVEEALRVGLPAQLADLGAKMADVTPVLTQLATDLRNFGSADPVDMVFVTAGATQDEAMGGLAACKRERSEPALDRR